MRPFVTNDELGNDAIDLSNSTRSLNQTDSTLVPPPSQTSTTAEIENPGYKSFSSAGSSNETLEFKSLDTTVTESSPGDEPAQPTEKTSPSTPVNVVSPEIFSSPLRPANVETPSTSTPVTQHKTTSFVDRIRNSRRSRRESSVSDPTRIQPKRNAKKKVNYKE